MTTTNDNRSKHKSDELLAGAFAGAVARMFTAPFDVLKIRFQLQFGTVKKYTSTAQAIKTICAEEGLWSLWKGNLSATYLWMTYSMIQFSSYEFFKSLGEKVPDPFLSFSRAHKSQELPENYSSTKSSLWTSLLLFLSGAGASITSTALTYPLDIMRTQFAIQGNVKTHVHMRSFITHTYRSKGIPGFYAGLPAAVVGIAPYMGLNFALYESCKTVVDRFKSRHEVSGVAALMLGSGLCGAVSGGVSKFLVFPLDTVKRRMQAQVLSSTLTGMGSVPRYSSMTQCFVDTLRSEGIAGLYKGIAPTLIKSVAATAITFASYEGAKEFLKLRRILEKTPKQPPTTLRLHALPSSSVLTQH